MGGSGKVLLQGEHLSWNLNDKKEPDAKVWIQDSRWGQTTASSKATRWGNVRDRKMAMAWVKVGKVGRGKVTCGTQ